MLSKLCFSDEEVGKICKDPFKNLKTLVDDFKVEVNKGKGRNSTTSVKVLLMNDVIECSLREGLTQQNG